MRKTLAALAVTAGLAGGALIGAPILSAAAPGDPKPESTPAESRAKADRQGWAKKALADLVAKGTITQAQADAVESALKEARPDREGKHRGARRQALVVSAQVLGIEPMALRAELKTGKTVAAVAQAKGVDVQKVIDALVREGTARLAKAVADGKLTQAQADKRLAALPALVATFVNSPHPAADPTP